MINKAVLQERVREWGLREDVVEKDYVLGWVLWGIGSHPSLATTWAFKGGTCLKKCYVETYRFSEDLDFTVMPGGPLRANELAPIFSDLLHRVNAESGIDFSGQAPLFKEHPTGLYTEGRLYYRGPRSAPRVAGIKVDLSASEKVARPTVLRPIASAYPDALPSPATVRCYCFEELFAEKTRAFGERGRSRDLYDIIHLFRRPDLRAEPAQLLSLLTEKCQSKGLAIPTMAAQASAPSRGEMESEWANMLSHQLPALPPFESFWSELPSFFAWLEGTLSREALPSLPESVSEGSDESWAPPSTVWVWGQSIAIEPIRFAAANHLRVRLGYEGSIHLIEPYALRRGRDGYLLHALHADTHTHRAYRVNQVESAQVTTQPFRPAYRVEFSRLGPDVAPPTTSASSPSSRRPTPASRSSDWVHIIECPSCNRRFHRKKRDSKLNPHKTPAGDPCSARRGLLVDSHFE